MIVPQQYILPKRKTKSPVKQYKKVTRCHFHKFVQTLFIMCMIPELFRQLLYFPFHADHGSDQENNTLLTPVSIAKYSARS